MQAEVQQYPAVKFFESSIGAEALDPCLSRLLSLFPHVASLHVPVRVALPGRAKGASEKSMIQFGDNHTAILSVNYPLSCGEAVRVKPSAGSGESSAVVVAMIPKGQGTTVAVRFLDGAPKWISRA